MAAACAQTPTGMSAVLGGDPDEVLAAIDKHGLTPANMNGAGQIVAAGALDGLEALKADPPAKARIMPLSVAGAFHTEYMASAREELEGVVAGLRPGRPEPAAALQRRRRRRRLRRRGACAGWSARSPARCASTRAWPPCASSGVTAVVELPPAGALAGLAKREWKGCRTSRSSRSRRPRTSTAPASCSAARRVTDPGYDLAGRRLPRPRHGQPGRGRRGQPSAGRLPARRRPQPPRGSERLSRLRRGTGRVARPRGRPRRRRRPDRPSLPGGRQHERHPAARPAPPAPASSGSGAYRPRRRVTNDDLAQVMDTNDEWIQTPGRHRRAALGVARTRRSSPWPPTRPPRRSLTAGVDPLDAFDLVILASCSMPTPAGPGVDPRAGRARPRCAPGRGAFDLNAACAGFCYVPVGVAADGGARRLRPQRRRRRLRRSCPTGPTGPTAGRRSCSATAPAPPWSVRHRRSRDRPGRLGQRRVALADLIGVPVGGKLGLDGGPGRVPVGDHHANGGGRPAGVRRRRGRAGRPRACRAAPGQPPHRRVDDQAARLRRQHRRRPRHRPGRATRRPPRSRWRSPR